MRSLKASDRLPGALSVAAAGSAVVGFLHEPLLLGASGPLKTARETRIAARRFMATPAVSAAGGRFLLPAAALT